MNPLLPLLTIIVALILSACSSSEGSFVELSLDEDQLNSVYQRTSSMDVDELLADTESMQVAQWLFSESCSSCHQADAKGRMGVPDLTDDHWLFEGTESSVNQTISSGRLGLMPEFSSEIGEVELGLLVAYIETIGQVEELNSNETAGSAIYTDFCVACHSADGTGIANLGPNLTDEHWQWGGNMITIRQSISVGRTAECPAQEEILTGAQIQLLTAYVLGLETDPTDS